MQLPFFEERREILAFYHPFNFCREIGLDTLLNDIQSEILRWSDSDQHIMVDVGDAVFFCKNLVWDTAFFGMKTAKICYALFPELNYAQLINACRQLLNNLQQTGFEYVYLEIPPEDILLIQALNQAGMKSSETRLIYYNDELTKFDFPRYGVRKARLDDIPTLRSVASEMRNKYDRFHADPAITLELGDAFLAKYVEEGVKGYNDVVLVPDEPGVASHAFFTANLLSSVWHLYPRRISKIVLTAASSLTNRGWHYKLFVETTYWLREHGADIVYMPTQSTNRAVIRNCEKLGYKYGGSFHVLTVRF